MYIICKKIPRCPSYYLIHFIYFISYITTIPFYIFNNTLILPIGPLNTNTRQLKKMSHIELISTVESLNIDLLLSHTSTFSTGRTGRIMYRKNHVTREELLCSLGYIPYQVCSWPWDPVLLALLCFRVVDCFASLPSITGSVEAEQNLNLSWTVLLRRKTESFTCMTLRKLPVTCMPWKSS
jgi:hypothetical protein